MTGTCLKMNGSLSCKYEPMFDDAEEAEISKSKNAQLIKNINLHDSDELKNVNNVMASSSSHVDLFPHCRHHHL